jgi:hypothetical protein
MAWWIVSGCVVILLTDRIRDLWRQVSDPLGNRVDIALLRQQEFKKTDRLEPELCAPAACGMRAEA